MANAVSGASGSVGMVYWNTNEHPLNPELSGFARNASQVDPYAESQTRTCRFTVDPKLKPVKVLLPGAQVPGSLVVDDARNKAGAVLTATKLALSAVDAP